MKKYIPEKMVAISRYRNYIPRLPEDIKQDIYDRVNELIEEEAYRITSEEMWKVKKKGNRDEVQWNAGRDVDPV
ncbi:MAG: hypothetical protein IJS12_03055 [Lachnospiraceae bacterium]|nr:hypothetical protein [Lachnospiraceae bacterium]